MSDDCFTGEGLIVSVGCFIISIMCESNNKGLNILAFVNRVIIVSQVKSFSLTVLIEPMKNEITGIKTSKTCLGVLIMIQE